MNCNTNKMGFRVKNVKLYRLSAWGGSLLGSLLLVVPISV